MAILAKKEAATSFKIFVPDASGNFNFSTPFNLPTGSFATVAPTVLDAGNITLQVSPDQGITWFNDISFNPITERFRTNLWRNYHKNLLWRISHATTQTGNREYVIFVRDIYQKLDGSEFFKVEIDIATDNQNSNSFRLANGGLAVFIPTLDGGTTTALQVSVDNGTTWLTAKTVGGATPRYWVLGWGIGTFGGNGSIFRLNTNVAQTANREFFIASGM